MSEADPGLAVVPREIEMKLDLDDAGAAAIEDHLSAKGAPEQLEQRSIYFDTPERKLLRAGVSLRVRETNGRIVQTAKEQVGTTIGLFDRLEWEVRAEGMRPVPDPRVRGATLDAEMVAALEPLFEVRTSRLVWPAALHGGVEVALDRVVIDAGGCRRSFCELELELKGRRQDAMHSLVRRLDPVAPLRIGVSSKAERGERLLLQCEVGRKAEPVALDPAMPAARAMAAVIASCVRQYRANEATLLERHVPEAVHQARVALRRLRSALAIFDDVIDDRGRAFDPPLRELAATLGAVRDLEVVIETIGRSDLEKELTVRRAAAYSVLDAALRSAATRALFLDLSEWLADMRTTEPSGAAALPIAQFASRAMDRARRRLKRRAANFPKQTATQRHRVRKAAKRLRYGHDFFASMFAHEGRRDPTRRFGKALARLQDHLGALNDRAVAETILKSVGCAPQSAAERRMRAKREARLVGKASQRLTEVAGLRRYWRHPRRLLERPLDAAG